MVKQVGLLAAGCQPWYSDVCSASGDRFAYCATLAIYVYQLDRTFNEFRLLSILSDHKNTVTALSWNPRNPDILASSSSDNRIIVWDIPKQKPISILENAKGTPISMDWSLLGGEGVSYAFGRGPVYIWEYQGGSELAVSTVKETANMNSDICKVRWHSKRSNKVVVGHMDGSISICNLGSKALKHVLQPEKDMDDEADIDCVTALEWDPLSTDYLLICNKSSGVRLVDTVSVTLIMRFHLPSVATKVHTLSWVASAPGMFVTGDSLTGVMRLWNASKPNPIENIQLKKSAFHVLHSICDNNPTLVTDEKDSSSDSNMLSSTSWPRHQPWLLTLILPFLQARLSAPFGMEGSGFYNLGRRKWIFLREQGHVETIFDCKFHPENPDLLATGSFDGTIKVWDTNTFTAVHSSSGNEGVIYSISWAPAYLNHIVACTSKLGIFVWDIRKGIVIKRFKEHGKNPVYTVAWNQHDSRRIMSCGGDGNCIIRTVDGAILQIYKHPGPVFGCDWSPHNKDMLATGCDDGCVRVFYLMATTDQPLKVFPGHEAKVFHVRWSPLLDGILCSGSDDSTVRIWDYTQETCTTVLKGHTGPIRGLLWNTEIPYLLISGSWDCTIRMWDIRDGACLDTILDHGADVYGLTCHPGRPFILASCSRDSTVRLWSLTSLVQPIELNIIAGKPWSEILGTTDKCNSLTSPLLTGKTSRDLKLQSEEFPQNLHARSLKFFSKFFLPPGGTTNLWELVSVVQGMDDTMLSQNYSKGIMHVKHLSKFKSSEAQELEMIKMSKFGGGIGSRSKEDRLKEAAGIHIKLGNIQRYCELMVELGEWEKAISVAPGVSIEYWKDLATRYTKFLMKEDSDNAVPYAVATADSNGLTKFFVTRGQMADAVLTAQMACEGTFLPQQHRRTLEKDYSSNNGKPSKDDLESLHKANENLADFYFRNGSPILSACCFLAVDDCQKTITRLIQGNELELAVSVGLVLGNLTEHMAVAVELLSRRCEHLGKWELALDLLKLIPNNELLLCKCCARYQGGAEEIEYLHQRAGLPSLKDCLHEAEKLKHQIRLFDSIKYYLLSTCPERGLELGLQEIRSKLKRPDWSVDEIFDILQLLGCIRTDKLQHHDCAQHKVELLALSAYIGAFIAIRRSYNSIVPALFLHAGSLLQRNPSPNISVEESKIQEELKTWCDANQDITKLKSSSTTVENKSAYRCLVEKAGQERCPSWMGPDCVASSHLPSHSDVHTSCLTGQRVQGLALFLEDGKSPVSPNEALMWAKVNPFSPLGTGRRINPF
ncbi:hypothetical protein ACJMK2_031231 [Sinanodonta woodiana]|uniref:WD repeat-containing protein 17 n=1 Tax=Sinanodonta woodiana TaxID=1069815 RepID=A0ABD3X230_SINWO